MIDKIPTFEGINITFNTGESCNLACKYCYEFNKKPTRLTFETAKDYIDLLLADKNPLNISPKDDIYDTLQKGVILDFIGGEPFMETELITRICRYFVYKVNILEHKWATHWRISISTNGTLLDKPEVRAFIEEFSDNLSFGISLDGNKAYHDLNRVYPDGSGSFTSIMKNWEYYKRIQRHLSTKSTLNKESIPYIYDSLVFMHEKLGIQYINQNYIFENTFLEEKDLLLFEEQLKKSIDYVYLHKDDLYWSMIDKRFVNSGKGDINKGWCGSGMMPALSPSGKIYPCFRWLPHSVNSDMDYTVGNVKEGFTHKEVFSWVANGAKRCNIIQPEKCQTCPIESQCAYCIAGCYTEFKEFRRQTHICEITKLQYRYANIYWERVKKEESANE